MPIDKVFLDYINQIHEITAAATEAKRAKDLLKQTGGGGSGQSSSTRGTGDGSLGHPSEPLSQTIAKQALVQQFNFTIGGGGSQTSGPNESAPSIAKSSGPFSDSNRAPGEMGIQPPGTPGYDRVNRGDLAVRAAASAVARAKGGDPLNEASEAELRMILDAQNPDMQQFKTRYGRPAPGFRPEKMGYRPDMNNPDNHPGIIGTYRSLVQGTDIVRRLTTWRMNESEIWDNLQSSAQSAHEGSWKQGLKIRARAQEGDMQMYKQFLRLEDLDNPYKDVSKSSIYRKAMDTADAFGITTLARNFKAVGAIAGAVYAIHEDVREAYFEEKSVQRMQPGLAKSIAAINLRQHNEDRVRNDIVHALAAGALLAPGGQPIALAIEGINYVYTMARDMYTKRYEETINKETGIADLIRKYSLGDTNKPATERAKGFNDKFRTEGEFRAQLESAFDDLHRGYARVGLGDFRQDVAREGGVGFLRRADEKMKGIAPSWYDPGKIFNMMDSSRLATRQFASTNTRRAQNRSGE